MDRLLEEAVQTYFRSLNSSSPIQNMRPRSMYTVLNILLLAMTTFASVEDDCSSWTSFAGKKMYTISQACFESIPSKVFATISPSQMYKMDSSTGNNQCAALSAEQFAQIPATSLVRDTSSQSKSGLKYTCSSKFNDNVLKSISKSQLGSIFALAFNYIPVATFKNIPAEAFAALTGSQMYKMDSTTDNNQCAALSAEQFAQIPAASLVYKSSQSKSGLKYSCSSMFNDNVLKSISKSQLGSIFALTFNYIPVATFKNIPAEAFAALTGSQMYKMDSVISVQLLPNNQCLW